MDILIICPVCRKENYFKSKQLPAIVHVAGLGLIVIVWLGAQLAIFIFIVFIVIEFMRFVLKDTGMTH